MRRNKHSTSILSQRIAFIAALLLSFCTTASAQSYRPSLSPYTIVSSSPNEVTIKIEPSYEFREVTDEKTSEIYEQVGFYGSTKNGLKPGAPSAEWIPIELLLPSQQSAVFEITDQQFAPTRNATLAPVAKWTFAKDEFKSPQEHIIADKLLYAATPTELVTLASPSVYRTAYTQELRINPIQYDASTHSIRLVKSMTVKVEFVGITEKTERISTTSHESDFFASLFANGNTYQFYNSAAARLTAALRDNRGSYKNSASVQANEKWLAVTTSEQGVYKITADQLSKAGVSNPDPSTIQLFGYGGQAIPEDLDSATGELHECAIDIIKADDGAFIEARFYEPGITEWHYFFNSGDPLYGFYHILNPFTSSGHYVLKAGGDAGAKRIATNPDQVSSPIDKNVVEVVAVHESEERFENPAISREFVGEEIPNGRTVVVSLPSLVGLSADPAVIRPGFNSRDTGPHSFNLTLNGTVLNPIIDGSSLTFGGEQYTARNWGTEIPVASMLNSGQNSLVLSATTPTPDAKFWLNWVEIFYHRNAALDNGQVPFYLLADGGGYKYNFTSATSGEAWDVSDPFTPVKLASSSGSSMSVPVQGNANDLRQFVAFTASSLKTPSLSGISGMLLRNGICQSGATDIIITPIAFTDAANKLAKQRTMGGQATGPMSVAVVTVEDIYREFGFGSNDYSAIRNFLAFTLRHTTANSTTKPLFATLFANGHCDYRNKTTSNPIGLPIYETWKVGTALRSGEPSYTPDDAFFVKLVPGSFKMDMAVGRVTVHDADEANAFVTKVIKYETSSDQGDWRAHSALICDDRIYENGLYDPLQHIFDTENEMKYVPERILKHDIFGQSYIRVPTAGGIRMPEMEKAIVDAFNSGSIILSWVGHGNPAIWAHEAILTVPGTINKLTNFNRLAFVTTATCDFSACDDYIKPVSGGVLLITKPDGGAIGSLGTSRSVYPDQTAPTFYNALFDVGCNELQGSAPVGTAYIRARQLGGQGLYYLILGDPTQRLLIPRQYVSIDSINGAPFNKTDAPRSISALSQLTISGHVSNSCDGSDIDGGFNGNVTVTLFDAPSHVSATSVFPDHSPVTDAWEVDGPILYHGSSTVVGGKYRTTFIVSKDIKFDTNNAKISMLAYSDNFKSALGVTTNILIKGVDTTRANSDHNGPILVPFIGSRAFKSGDVVPVNSKIIVDVTDISGLNTSTASIGHSFVAWTDDSTAGTIDMASTYVSKQDDYSSGTSIQQARLPVGTHILRVRAFDALDNPTFAEVEFTARDVEPYSLYNTQIIPNPVRNDRSYFTFLQPSAPESPVDVTITIYTVIGQKVRELSAQSISQNSVSIPFDGNDDGGTPLADGAYAYRINARERLTSNQTTMGGTFIIVRK
ncbi:MAG: type IX secretion system sortase PorU [Ignavibacteriota bacterium]